MSKVTRLDYCQFLLISRINYTLKYFANHTEQFSHDGARRYQERDKITPRLVWEDVQAQVVTLPQDYVVFDDTVLEKQYAREIEVVRKQYSGNEHRGIRGIGVVTCVYCESGTGTVLDYGLSLL